MTLFFLPGSALSAAPAGAAAATAQGAAIGDWGDLGVRAHIHQDIPVCCGERRLPRSGMVSPGHDNTLLRRLTVVQDGEQGMWCPLCGCLAPLPALPSPSQRCVGLTGVGRWGGSEGLPSLGAWQENVVLSLGGSEGLQWAAHPPALQV